MQVSKEANQLMNLLSKYNDVYLVGGCVRDYVMRQPIHDEDIATSLTPDEISDILQLNGYPVIPVGAKFGTINTVINDKTFEITTFRKELGYSDGRHPDGVEYSRNLLDDAARRDFTCNAMYYSYKNDEIIDPFEGMTDISNHVLRAVGNAEDRLQEDALRMLRAVRFCTIKNFNMDTQLFDAIRKNNCLIKNVSAERQFTEINKILTSDKPDVGIRLMAESGLLQEVLPEVAAEIDCMQNNLYHGNTVFEHTLNALHEANANDVVRWSVLLHDIGKVSTKTMGNDGRDHFYGHAQVSAAMTDKIMRRMKCSNDFRKDVNFCVGLHDTCFEESKQLKTRVVRLYVDKYAQAVLFERNVDNLMSVQIADVKGQNGKVDIDKRLNSIQKFHDTLLDLLSGPHNISDLAVNGNEMMSVGLQPKEIPLMKRRLLHGMMLGSLSDKDSQMKFVLGNKNAVHDDFIRKSGVSDRRLPDVSNIKTEISIEDTCEFE